MSACSSRFKLPCVVTKRTYLQTNVRQIPREDLANKDTYFPHLYVDCMPLHEDTFIAESRGRVEYWEHFEVNVQSEQQCKRGKRKSPTLAHAGRNRVKSSLSLPLRVLPSSMVARVECLLYNEPLAKDIRLEARQEPAIHAFSAATTSQEASRGYEKETTYGQKRRTGDTDRQGKSTDTLRWR